MYRFTEAEHHDFKLRLHGYEIPFLGAKVTSGINLPASANIQLTPTKWAKMIRPGTIAHLFYKDHFSSILTGRDIYRLLFEGEVRSRSYQRSEGGKAITLNCTDFANYWLMAKIFYINFACGGIIGAANKMNVQGVTRAMASLLGSTGTMSRAFAKKNKRFDQVVKELLLSIENTNEYFKDAVSRLKMSDRILSQSTAKMTSEVFNHQAFLKVLEGNVSRSGGLEPVWKVITILLQMVFHELVCVAAPSFVEVRRFDEWSQDRSSRMYFKDEDINKVTIDWRREIVSQAYGDEYGPGQFIIKPNAWMLEPPSCNIIYPNEILNMAFVWDWQRRITRLQLVPTLPLFRHSGNNTFSELISTYAPQEFQDFMGTLVTKKLKDRVNRFATFLTDEELEVGIIPGFMSIIPGATSFLLSRFKADGDKKGIRKFIDQLADFEYERQRAAASSFDAQMVFKPHLTPGFPSIFIDDSEAQFDVSALPTVVTHSISSSGAAATQASFTLARELGEYKPGLDRDYPPNLQGLSIYQVPEEPPIPAWFDDAYTHGKIGSNVYGRILGCGGLLNAAAKSDKEIEFSFAKKSGSKTATGAIKTDPAYDRKHQLEIRSKIETAVAKLRSEYLAAASNGQGGYHVWKSTFRPIITEEQLYEANYSGKLKGAKSWFSKEQQTKVESDIFTRGLVRGAGGHIQTAQEIQDPSNKNTRYVTLNNTSLAKVQPSFAKGQSKSSGSSEVAKANLTTKQVKSAQDGNVVKPNPASSAASKSGSAKISKTANQPIVVTGAIFYDAAVQFTKGKRYVFGKYGPDAFDCSGVVYGTALRLGFKYPNIRKFSYDMFRFSCVRISVEDALKIKGAILFDFKTVTKHRKGKIIKTVKGHVGISAGDGRTTWEALNPSDGIQRLRRKNPAAAWSNAGLLIGVKYEGAPVKLPLSSIGYKTVNLAQLTDLTYVQHKISLIQLNRIEIVKRYQDEMFDTTAFLG